MAKSRVSRTVYQKIALDIASHIVTGKYREGEKLHGRSTLSGTYNVSPETIRRAIYLLKDVGIVSTLKGSGIEVISAKKAKEFLFQFEKTEEISHLKDNIFNLMAEQRKISIELHQKLSTVLDISERVKDFTPFIPFEIVITNKSKHLNSSISEMKFWQNTSATVVAIKRNNDFLLSPGPYAVFLEHDLVYIIGDEESYARAKNFLYPESLQIKLAPESNKINIKNT